jgi:hypothetical protein
MYGALFLLLDFGLFFRNRHFLCFLLCSDKPFSVKQNFKYKTGKLMVSRLLTCQKQRKSQRKRLKRRNKGKESLP